MVEGLRLILGLWGNLLMYYKIHHGMVGKMENGAATRTRVGQETRGHLKILRHTYGLALFQTLPSPTSPGNRLHVGLASQGGGEVMVLLSLAFDHHHSHNSCCPGEASGGTWVAGCGGLL